MTSIQKKDEEKEICKLKEAISQKKVNDVNYNLKLLIEYKKEEDKKKNGGKKN